MKTKIIAFIKITCKIVDDSFRVLFKTLTHSFKNIEKAMNRLDPILHSYRQDEKAAILEIQNEINYIKASIELCLSTLEDFEKSLGNKYLSAFNTTKARTKNAIYEKRKIFLEQYVSIASELFELIDLIENNNLDESDVSRDDFLKTYNEIQEITDGLKISLMQTKIKLRI